MGPTIIWIYLSMIWKLCELVVLLFCSVVSSASNIFASINSILVFNGTNFKAWQENAMIILGVMDLDLMLRVERPADLMDKSSSDDKRDKEMWDRSNHMSLMIMKSAILEAFRGTMS